MWWDTTTIQNPGEAETEKPCDPDLHTDMYVHTYKKIGGGDCQGMDLRRWGKGRGEDSARGVSILIIVRMWEEGRTRNWELFIRDLSK